MRKFLAPLFLVIFFLLISLNTANASLSKTFGGKISKNKAPEIAEAESLGFECDTTGKTIEVTYKKVPKSYFIANNIKPRTRHEVRAGQSILGLTSGQTTIVCNKEPKDSSETRETKTFRFDNITLFGTSRI